MNKELKELAVLALRNAFWHDFSALVNKYVEVASGLDTDLLQMHLSEMASIYGRDREAKGIVFLAIRTRNGEQGFFTTGYETILEALEQEDATEVHLCGKAIFERRNGEWYFTGDI